MPEETKTRIPAPIYAAAGAGDLAYRQLRKLPGVVTELRADLQHRAAATRVDLRERAFATLKAANETAAELRERAGSAELDIDRVREVARRNAFVVLTGAQAAQARATAAYLRLVAHGERVVGTGVVQAADTVNADIEATEVQGELTSADVAAVTDAAAKAEAAEKDEAKARSAKRTRPVAGR